MTCSPSSSAKNGYRSRRNRLRSRQGKHGRKLQSLLYHGRKDEKSLRLLPRHKLPQERCVRRLRRHHAARLHSGARLRLPRVLNRPPAVSYRRATIRGLAAGIMDGENEKPAGNCGFSWRTIKNASRTEKSDLRFIFYMRLIRF